MEELVKEGAFIENATFSGNMYGTSKEAVQHVLDSGKVKGTGRVNFFIQTKYQKVTRPFKGISNQ